MISLLSFLLALLSIGTTYSGEVKHSLDSHVHFVFNQDEQLFDKHLNEYLESTTGKSFAISPAYTVGNSYGEADSILQNLQTIKIWNDLTAAVIRKNPDRFLGLCGMHWGWKDFSHYLKECLKNPEMVGLKIRFKSSGPFNTDRFSNPEIFNNLSSALNDNPRARVVLIHTSIQDHYTIREKSSNHFHDEISLDQIFQSDLHELDSLISLAKLHPEVKFIIAHSFNSQRMVTKLSRKLKLENSVTNIYIEISKAFNGHLQNQEVEYVQAWKEFGLDRVLYGSDITLGAEENWSIINNKYKFNLSISDAVKGDRNLYDGLFKEKNDKDLVFFKNGEALLNELLSTDIK